MFQVNQKTLVLTSVVNYLRENVTNYFSYIARSTELDDYILEANFVARQMSMDKGKISIKKLALIDLECKQLADTLKIRSEHLTGVSTAIGSEIDELIEAIYTECSDKKDFSKTHIERLFKKHQTDFLKLARDFLYSKLEPVFVAADNEIRQMSEPTQKSKRKFQI